MAGIPLTDLQDKVLITQPMDVFQRTYSGAGIPWPALDEPVDEDAGSGAMVTATVAAGEIDAVAVGAGGSGYNTPPVIEVGGPGTGAVLTAVLTAGVVTSVTITDGGSGYTSAPDLTVVSAHWIAVGASPFNSDLYGREGSKISKPQEVMDYYGARTLGKIAAVRTKDDLMIDGTIYDASLETVAFLLDQDTREITAQSGTTPSVRRVGMSRPSTMREYSIVMRGTSALGEELVGQVHVPRARVLSAWDREFGVDKWAGKTTFQLGALVDFGQASVLDRLGFFDEQFVSA